MSRPGSGVDVVDDIIHLGNVNCSYMRIAGILRRRMYVFLSFIAGFTLGHQIF
jgi:hypothetical protein